MHLKKMKIRKKLIFFKKKKPKEQEKLTCGYFPLNYNQ